MRKWERQPAWIYNEHAGGSGTTCSDLHLDPDIELTNIIPKSAQTEDISKENKYCLSGFFFKLSDLRLPVEDIETFVAGAESSLPTVSVPESQQDSDSCQDIGVVRKACRTIGDFLDNFLLLYMPDYGN